MAVTIQIRRDTEANWTSNNPVLAVGEFAYSTDTYKVKVGNGSSAWTALDYINSTPAELSAAAGDSFPDQSGHSGQYLTTDGSVVSWAAVANEIADQSGQSGKYLTTDGSTTSWATIEAGSGSGASDSDILKATLFFGGNV